MKAPRKSKLKKALELAVLAYVDKFCKKHEVEVEYFVADDLLGIVSVSDFSMKISDIVLDIDTKQPKHGFIEWYDQTIDRGMENKQTINYKSWCMGLRYTDLK